jgi:Domain of unknown function (DUF4345)
VQISSVFNTIGAGLTIGLGIVGLSNPTMVARLVGIMPTEPRGLSEIRATYGGLFIGLGGLALSAQDPIISATVGCGWMGAAIARLISIVIDRQMSKLNIGGIVLEGGIAILLLFH